MFSRNPRTKVENERMKAESTGSKNDFLVTSQKALVIQDAFDISAWTRKTPLFDSHVKVW